MKGSTLPKTDLVAEGVQRVFDATPWSIADFCKGTGRSVNVTKQLQECLDEAPDGAVIDIPTGWYLYDELNPGDKTLTLRGHGWWSEGAPFGSPDWQDPTKVTGTVLESRAASGTAINAQPTKVRALNLEQLALTGPGSGTSEGVRLGSAAHPMARCQGRHLLIGNFAKGLVYGGAQLCHYEGLYVRSCPIAVEAEENSNANGIAGLFIDWGDLRLVGSVLFRVLFGAIQGATGDIAIIESCHGCELEQVYFENSGGTWAVNIEGGDRNALRRCHFGTAGDGLLINGANTRVEWPQALGAITVGANGGGSELVTDVLSPAIHDSNGNLDIVKWSPHTLSVQNPRANGPLGYEAVGKCVAYLRLVSSYTGGEDWRLENRSDLAGMSIVNASRNQRPLRMSGDANGPKIGFNGAQPQSKVTLPAAASDAATTQALVNAIRQLLIDVGLAV